jgi:parallel beta-helix repeat protein
MEYIFPNLLEKLDGIIVENNYDGVHLAGSNDNELYNITAISNRGGIFLDNLHGNAILNSIIDDNSIIGIEIIGNSSIVLIYNNYFRNSVNALIQTSGINYWNIGKTPGRNIVSGYTGGNYWDNRMGMVTVIRVLIVMVMECAITPHNK